jgi:hypothetical protein
MTTPGKRQIMRSDERGELVVAMQTRDQVKDRFRRLLV